MRRRFNSARNAVRMGWWRRMWLPGTAPGQAFHDREGFYIKKRSKVFAIM
jgi:hypothetical protein